MRVVGHDLGALVVDGLAPYVALVEASGACFLLMTTQLNP